MASECGEGKMKPSATRFDALLTALAPTVWGSSYIVTTEWLPADRPLLAATVRALPAGIILIALARQKLVGHWWMKALLLGVLNFSLFFGCLFAAAYHLPGGTLAMVMGIQPLVVIGLSALILKQQVTRQKLLAVLVGLSGLSLLVFTSHAQLDNLGLFIAALGTVSMALGNVLIKHWGRPQGVSLVGFTGWQLLFGGLVLLPFTLYIEGVPEQLTFDNLIGYSYLCLFGAIFGYLIWFRGLERMSPVSASFIGFMSPVSANVLGYLFLDQAFGHAQALGAGLILFSVVISIWEPNRSKGINKRHATV